MIPFHSILISFSSSFLPPFLLLFLLPTFTLPLPHLSLLCRAIRPSALLVLFSFSLRIGPTDHQTFEQTALKPSPGGNTSLKALFSPLKDGYTTSPIFSSTIFWIKLGRSVTPQTPKCKAENADSKSSSSLLYGCMPSSALPLSTTLFLHLK